MAKRIGSAMVVAMAMAALLLGGADAANAAAHVKQALHATSYAPHARGSAKLTLKKSKGLFSVAARRLASGASYDVVVAGIKVGSLATNASGKGKVVLQAPKRGHRGLLGFDPRGRSLAVRDHEGHDVLDGEIPDDSSDPGEVACCLPDDDGVECDDRKPEDCLDDGGTVSSATGCFPNPCATPPAGTSVCCTIDSTCGAFVDDDPQVGCHTDLSAADCAEVHGTVVEATSCDPNPCTPIPPVQLVTCCVPEDDDEVECEFRTPELCATKGGTVVAAATCHPNPCGGASSMSHGDEQGDDDHQGDDDDQGDGDHCDHHGHDGDSGHDGGDGHDGDDD